MKASVQTIFKAVLLSFLALVYFGLKDANFDDIDRFSRDALQFLNFNEPLDSRIVTLNINIGQNGIAYPHTFESTKKVIEKVQSYKPRNIVLMMEPLDFSSSIENKKLLFDFLINQKNIYLNNLDARDRITKFENDEVFKNYPKFTYFERCNDSPVNRENRRASLSIETEGTTKLIDSLQQMGLNPKPVDFYTYGFDYWNSRQAYIKNFPLGRYGYYQTHDLFADKIPASVFQDKVVIIGTHDHYSYLNARSTFYLFGAKRTADYNKTRVPLQDLFANIINFHTTGSYIKFLNNFNDLLLVICILGALVLLNIELRYRLYLFYSLLPSIIIFIIALYMFGSFYIDFSRSIILLIGLQYLTIPILIFVFYKDQQNAQMKAIDEARTEAFLTISEKVAHDIRSPLSTINLMLTKASFINDEHQNLIFNSLKRVNNIVDSLLAKNTLAGYKKIILEKTNVKTLVDEILLEKKELDKRINYEFNSAQTTISDGLADPVELQRIISNVLDNSIFALKAVSNPKVSINLTQNESELVLTITDNGLGISENILKLLGQQRITTKNSKEGSGIGILHAKQVITNMAGKFDIESPNSQGTIVTIRLKSAP